MAETTQEAFANLHKALRQLKETILTEHPFLIKLPGLYDSNGRLRFFVTVAYASIINAVITLTAYGIEYIIK